MNKISSSPRSYRKDIFRIIGIFFLFLLGQMAALLMAFALTSISKTENSPLMLMNGQLPVSVTALGISTIVIDGLLIATLCLFKWSKLKFNKSCPTSFPATGKQILYFTAIFILIALGFNLLWGLLSLNDGGSTALFFKFKGNIWVMILTVFIGPLTEEIVFRAGLLRILNRHFQTLGAIFLSALLFAVAHGNFAQGFNAFFLAIPLGFLYLRSRDLRFCLPAHIANNLLGWQGLHHPQYADIGTQWPVALQIIVAIFLIFIGSIGLFCKKAPIYHSYL